MCSQDLESLTFDHLIEALDTPGYQFLPANHTLVLLGGRKALADWAAFASSWNELPLDTYMADAGRYRRRRHAVFETRGERIVRAPHRAHYQSPAYNTLNGGIERWYEPIVDEIASGPTLERILLTCHATFAAVAPKVRDWEIEVHQFRIEASSTEPGKPTPEGMHRDGVDYVLVLLVARHNVASGTTLIGGEDGLARGSFTLTAPFDAVMLDDHRVFHGVTAIEPIDPERSAKRDVLVVTFRETGAKDTAMRSF
jgi:hypothetical protein